MKSTDFHVVLQPWRLGGVCGARALLAHASGALAFPLGNSQSFWLSKFLTKIQCFDRVLQASTGKSSGASASFPKGFCRAKMTLHEAKSKLFALRTCSWDSSLCGVLSVLAALQGPNDVLRTTTTTSNKPFPLRRRSCRAFAGPK